MTTTATALLWASDHQYYVRGDEFDTSGFSYTGFNGLLAPLTAGHGISRPGHFALIMTGTELGPVRVTLTQHTTTPPPPELDAWDDIVEAGLHLSGTRPGITDAHDTDPLPPLAHTAGHPCRIRVCARGRDLGHQQLILDDHTPLEHHLIEVWPGPTAPLRIWQTTDAYGASFR
ncbi:hypothetical protein [Streptomyces sp. VRA16 Mangrove soil]|uniref:hypothetical protein n=1 Tax=Streptomyces sp. VRA16 Mangrove soil TaxID=2817434 RepID=UPI001A9FFC31|nr:hypothetical protein [Streptomyces sp. VRA16 Mangrove soil]MBO1337948.1 hypothetical protein [Streptomyces sp. VRA16 Mangrove soil]